MNLFAAAGLIGFGYMASDILKNHRISFRPSYTPYHKYGDYSIGRTIRHIVCDKINAKFSDKPKWNSITFNTREEACDALLSLEFNIRRYGYATICDYYDVCKCFRSIYSYSTIGWDDLSDAEILRDTIDGKYYISFPEPRPVEEFVRIVKEEEEDNDE